jgi:hypothetical protein
MPNIENESDRQAAGIALFGPAHRQLHHYFRLRNNGKMGDCDALHEQVKQDHTAWKEIAESNSRSRSIWTFLGIIMASFSTLGELEPVDVDAEKKAESKYYATLWQYESKCLGKTEPSARKSQRGVMHRTWDAVADGLVRGGRFMADHPTEVAIGIGVGAVLVFAPEAAPLVLAF